MNKKTIFFLFTCCILVLAACKAECPPERITYIEDTSFFPLQTALLVSESTWIEIKGKETQVDRVISGPVCNDTLQGTVYLTCDIQIPAWEGDPFFFQDCDFEVEDGAVVYVEAHNDKRYDKGCSCHE